MTSSHERLHKRAAFASVLIVALAWEVTVRVVWPDARYVFPLSSMLTVIPSLFLDGQLGFHLLVTLGRTLSGFAVAGIVGCTCGILIARSPLLNAVTKPLIDFLRPLPSSALIPVVTLLPAFAFSERSYMLIIVFGSIWPVLFNTIVGVGEVSRAALDAIRLVPLSKWERMRLFTLPEAAPEIFTGLKVSLSICLILTITAELLIQRGSLGLGAQLELLKNAGQYLGMYAVILVIAVVGWGLNWLFGTIERLHPWLRHREDSLLMGEA